MLTRKFIMSAVLAAATVVPAVVQAAPTTAPPCILSEHAIVSVVPYKVDEHIGKNVVQRVRGAQVYLRAEPAGVPGMVAVALRRRTAG